MWKMYQWLALSLSACGLWASCASTSPFLSKGPSGCGLYSRNQAVAVKGIPDISCGGERGDLRNGVNDCAVGLPLAQSAAIAFDLREEAVPELVGLCTREQSLSEKLQCRPGMSKH